MSYYTAYHHYSGRDGHDDIRFREGVRNMNMSAASLPMNSFSTLTRAQMADLAVPYSIAWAAEKGDTSTLTMLRSMNWVLPAKNADSALLAMWWVSCPFNDYDRAAARRLGSVIRDALKRGIPRVDFATKGEPDIAAAMRRAPLQRAGS